MGILALLIAHLNSSFLSHLNSNIPKSSESIVKIERLWLSRNISFLFLSMTVYFLPIPPPHNFFHIEASATPALFYQCIPTNEGQVSVAYSSSFRLARNNDHTLLSTLQSLVHADGSARDRNIEEQYVELLPLIPNSPCHLSPLFGISCSPDIIDRTCTARKPPKLCQPSLPRHWNSE